MKRFIDFVAAVERIALAAGALRDRLDLLLDGRPLVPVVRSSIELCADELGACVLNETPFGRPRDMIDEEWSARELVELRDAIATLGLVAGHRPDDLRDWLPDIRLALGAFELAHERFHATVEM